MKFITVREFAESLSVSRFAIYKRIKAGDIRVQVFGKLALIPAVELGKWRRIKGKKTRNLHKI